MIFSVSASRIFRQLPLPPVRLFLRKKERELDGFRAPEGTFVLVDARGADAMLEYVFERRNFTESHSSQAKYASSR